MAKKGEGTAKKSVGSVGKTRVGKLSTDTNNSDNLQTLGITNLPRKRGNPNMLKGAPSVNPKGAPRKDWVLIAKCQDMSPKIIDRLYAIVMDKTGREAVEAAKIILAYGHGRPRETVKHEVALSPQAILEELRKRQAGSLGDGMTVDAEFTAR